MRDVRRNIYLKGELSMNYILISSILVFLFGIYVIYGSYIFISKKASCKFILNKKVFNLNLFIAMFVSQGFLKLHEHSNKIIVIIYFIPPLVYAIYLLYKLQSNYMISIINVSDNELSKDIVDVLIRMEIAYRLEEKENDKVFYLDNGATIEVSGDHGYYNINFTGYKVIKRFSYLIESLKSSVKHRKYKHRLKDSLVLLLIGITITLVGGYFVYLGLHKYYV